MGGDVVLIHGYDSVDYALLGGIFLKSLLVFLGVGLGGGWDVEGVVVYFVDGLEVHHKFIASSNAALGLELGSAVGGSHIFLEVGFELGGDVVHDC